MDEDRFRRQARNRLLMLLAVLVAVAVAFWYFSRPAGHARIASIESAAGNAVAKEVQKNVSNPAPLIATGTKSSAPRPRRECGYAHPNRHHRGNKFTKEKEGGCAALFGECFARSDRCGTFK